MYSPSPIVSYENNSDLQRSKKASFKKNICANIQICENVFSPERTLKIPGIFQGLPYRGTEEKGGFRDLERGLFCLFIHSLCRLVWEEGETKLCKEPPSKKKYQAVFVLWHSSFDAAVIHAVMCRQTFVSLILSRTKCTKTSIPPPHDLTGKRHQLLWLFLFPHSEE